MFLLAGQIVLGVDVGIVSWFRSTSGASRADDREVLTDGGGVGGGI